MQNTYMKYQIVRTGGKFYVRQRSFLWFYSFVRNELGNRVEFASEQKAVDFLVKLSDSQSSYHGIVVREMKFEEYNND